MDGRKYETKQGQIYFLGTIKKMKLRFDVRITRSGKTEEDSYRSASPLFLKPEVVCPM